MPGTLLLSVQNATIGFGNKPLFENLTFNITEGEKICLIGKNGAGKTTLMNIIRGLKDPDDGTIWRLDSAKIGYLQQEVHPVPGQTVFDFVFAELSDENRNESNAYKVDMVPIPLGLDPAQPMETLSGGQLRGAALARALVEDPDILLMDEPTNHLDLDIIEWLENYLKSWRGALVVVSHDKAFLAAVSDRVFWLDRGRLRVCPRGFAHFDDWASQLLEQEARELHNRERALALELEWASRGVKARRKRNVRRLELVKEERDKLKRDVNAFKRMMAKIDMPDADYAGDMPSKMLAEFKNVHKKFENKVILDKFSMRILRGDRIGLLGRNGSGKTTFLKLMLGELKPEEGTVKLAKDIEYSYFDQNRRDLDPRRSLWSTMCPQGGDHVDVRGKSRHVVGYLKDFLFDPATVHQPVGTLSGGQKNRLMLAKILANPKSLLILDEPTNDLDMDTLDMLEEILSAYDGTLIVVSHDRDFLDQTVTKILAFEGNGKIEGHIGGYSDYLEAKRKHEQPVREKEFPRKTSAPEKTTKAKTANKLSYKHQYELDKLPDRIAALEEEIGQLEDLLNDPDLYGRDPASFQNSTRRLVTVREELEAAENRWLELSEMAASAS